MVTEIHRQNIAEGQLTIFSNGDYVLVEGNPEAEDAVSTYYQYGNGPYPIQLLVNRIVAAHLIRARSLEQRGTGATRDDTGEVSPRAAVRGMSSEDEQAVPLSARSDTSRFRSDLRLRDSQTRAAEQLRRQRAQAAYDMGRQLGSLHGHLQFLITTQGDRPRRQPVLMSHGTTSPGAQQTRPTDLQLAIEAGLVIENTDGLSIADAQQGMGNDIVDQLGEDLPGFQEQYEHYFELTGRQEWEAALIDDVLAVIDLIDLLVSMGVLSAALRSMRIMYRGAARIIRTAEGSLAGRAGRSAVEVIPTADIPAGAIDATPRSTGSALATRGRAATGEAVAEAAPPQAALPETTTPPGQPLQLLPDNPIHPSAGILIYHGPLVARSSQETLIREIFGAERLRNLLAGLRLLDEVLPEAIRTVFGRTHMARGLPPAVSDARLRELLDELRRIIPDRAPLETDALTAAQQTSVRQILAEARTVARNRWNSFRERLWRQLYGNEQVTQVLRMMDEDGLISLPAEFPATGYAPRAIAGNRDGIILTRTREGVPTDQIARELNISPELVERRQRFIRRRMTEGEAPPPLIQELPLNIDHITPVQLNPFNFFHPNNLRVLTASYNDTFLRLYQMTSPFPMTEDSLEAWIRSFRLY